MPGLISSTAEYAALAKHAPEVGHLKELLQNAERNKGMLVEAEGIVLDYSRQRMTAETMPMLVKLAEKAGLEGKRDAMFGGVKINATEGRAAYHVALRAQEGTYPVDGGADQLPFIRGVLDKIEVFSEKVRSGSWVGATGKKMKTILAIGIGGSYLGPEFVYESLKASQPSATKLDLKFLANVDPVDFQRQTEGLDAETTLAVVVSKSFTTAETMANAKVVKAWLAEGVKKSQGGVDTEIIRKHVVAVSTQKELTSKFGIDPENVFEFGDYVGGRFSVHSPVGMLPLALAYGMAPCRQFLAGAHAMDQHFKTAPLASNLPVVLGLCGLYNSTFLGYECKALLPYAQSLLRFPAHVQQLDCESNGKSVSLEGEPLDFSAGEVVFGEPGTNGQHSFYQLLHQGRVVPCEFVGFAKSQAADVTLEGSSVSNHDELMANFFAQPDALALGKDDPANPHKVFSGNRPSLSILLPEISPFTMGQLLALYEHRVAVQGFVWGINSFDQEGVQLGKALAKQVLKALAEKSSTSGSFNSSTVALLDKYFELAAAATQK